MRKAKLTEELIDRFSQAVSLGLSNTLAAKYAGFSESVLYKWLAEAKAAKEKQGRLTKRERLCIKLEESLMKAVGRRAVRLMGRVEEASSNGDWKASAWMLERCHPNDYGKNVAVTGAGGGPVSVVSTVNTKALEAAESNPDVAEALALIGAATIDDSED